MRHVHRAPKMGLSNGNLNCVADAVGRSGAGLKSRIELLKERYEKGEFPKGAALFTDTKEKTPRQNQQREEAEE